MGCMAASTFLRVVGSLPPLLECPLGSLVRRRGRHAQQLRYEHTAFQNLDAAAGRACALLWNAGSAVAYILTQTTRASIRQC